MAEYVLSETDRNRLVRFMREFEELKRDLRSRGGPIAEFNDQMPPEMYVALTPPGGIPALTLEDVTGTGSGSGTAAGYRNTPGYADCAVYRVLYDGGLPNMYPTGVRRKVFNLNEVALPGSRWVTIFRDKYGRWYVPALGFGMAECV